MTPPILHPNQGLDAPAEADSEAEDPFRYGTRTLLVPQSDGSVDYRQIPLTLHDFLDPQEGDMMVQGTWHQWVVPALTGMLRRFLERSPEITVLSDVKLIWDVAGLSKPAPDICVVKGLPHRRKSRRSLNLKEDGVLPRIRGSSAPR